MTGHISRRGFLISAGTAAICAATNRVSGSPAPDFTLPLAWRQARAAIQGGLIGRVIRSQAHYDGSHAHAASQRVRTLVILLHATGATQPIRCDALGDGTAAYFMMTAQYADGHTLVLSSIRSERAVIRGSDGTLKIEGDRLSLAETGTELFRPLVIAAANGDVAASVLISRRTLAHC